MAQCVTEDGPADPAEFMRLVLASQQQQNEWVTIALEKTASRGQTRHGNVSDFRRLHSAVLTGEESHLDAKQWLIDTGNLLVAAQVPEPDRVNVVKIQLSGVTRIWWLAEESHLPRPVSW